MSHLMSTLLTRRASDRRTTTLIIETATPLEQHSSAARIVTPAAVAEDIQEMHYEEFTFYISFLRHINRTPPVLTK